MALVRPCGARHVSTHELFVHPIPEPRPEDAPARCISASALARNHQKTARAARMPHRNKPVQGCARRFLTMAMQIQDGVDFDAAAAGEAVQLGVAGSEWVGRLALAGRRGPQRWLYGPLGPFPGGCAQPLRRRNEAFRRMLLRLITADILGRLAPESVFFRRQLPAARHGALLRAAAMRAGGFRRSASRRGNNTTIFPSAFIAPAIRPASSPEPQ